MMAPRESVKRGRISQNSRGFPAVFRLHKYLFWRPPRFVVVLRHAVLGPLALRAAWAPKARCSAATAGRKKGA